MKVGILGGSFDPIHNGHMQMAKEAKRQLHLDEVWFLVAYDTPLKDRKLSSFYDRCKMVELAISAYSHFKICTIEQEFEGKSYTIQTMRELKKRYTHDFYFIFGGDHIEKLDKWKDIDILQKEVHLCAFERNKQKLSTPYDVTFLEMKDYPISSSMIRRGMFKEMDYKVISYIHEKQLYYDFIKEVMSEYRYTHSLSVAKLAYQIAKMNHLDANKAYVCGLLHDINKEFKMINVEDSMCILKHLKEDVLALPKSIWHGYMGAFICAHSLHIRDKDILIAIENHVLGDCLNAYAQIVYIADKLDPLRDYDTSETIALSLKDYHKAYLEVRKQQAEYYSKENVSGK